MYRKQHLYNLLTLIVAFPFVLFAQVEPTSGNNQADTSAGKATESLVRMMNTVSSGTQETIHRVSGDSIVKKARKSAFSDLVNYHAEDSISVDVQAGKAYLYNKAHIDYGKISLDAGYIELDWIKNEVYARGVPDSTGKIVQNPIFKQGDDLYETDEIRYNFTTNKAIIRTVITKEGENYLHGDLIKRIDENTFFIKGTAFTTCNKRHPHYHIGTERAKVIVGKQIVTGPAMLTVGDVPTPIILPFGFFPAQDKRSSGFIMPTYAKQQGKGYGLVNGGYYFSLSDYYDLAITGEVYSRGGWGLKGLSNYRKRYGYSGILEARYNRTVIGDPRYEEYGEFTDSRDFRIRWTHLQDPKARPDLTFSASVDLANPTFNKYNAMNDMNSYLQNTTTSSISVNKKWLGSPMSLNLTANHSQNNIKQDFDLSLPRAAFNVSRFFPFQRKVAVGNQRWYERIGMNYSANSEIKLRSNYDSLKTGADQLADGLKTGLQNNISISTSEQILNKITFSPSLTAFSKWYPYRLNYSYDENNKLITDTINSFSTVNEFNVAAQFSTKIYGTFLFRKGSVKAIRHMVTPQVSLSYKPDYSKEIFGAYQQVTDTAGNVQVLDRYSNFLYGGASKGESGMVNFNLGNNIEMKVRSAKDSTGERKVKVFDRLNFTSSYNIAAQEFKWSPVSLTAASSVLNNKIQITYQGQFDPYGYDPVLRKRVNQSALEVNGTLVRNTSSTFSLGSSWQGTMGEKRKSAAASTSSLGVEEDDPDWYATEKYMDISIPWSLSVNYNLNFSLQGLDRRIATNALTLNGTLRPTEKWSLVLMSGYDLNLNQVTVTQLNLVRDLHCWEMRITWVPFGFNQMYLIGLNIKASSFKDAKLERRRNIGDF